MPIGIYKRTKEHCENISKARKGCKQKPQCGFQKGHTKSNTGRTHFKSGNSCNVGRLRLDMRGEKNQNWNGGCTTEATKERNTPIYSQWRRGVYRRDYWTCQKCGFKGKKIQAHHIKSFKEYPDLRHDIKNGVTLCIPCHKKITFTFDYD